MIRHIASSIAYASYVKISIAEFSTNRIDHANWVGYPWATRVGLDAPWFAALRNSGEPTGTPVEMLEFIVAILLLVLGGLAAVLLSARPQAAQAAGQIGAIAGSALGLFVSIRALVTGEVEGMSGAWPMPGGSLHVEIDPLSAFFLLPVFGLSVVTGLYGRSYLAGGDRGRGPAATWFHLNLLTAAMALVITARDGLLFLLAWEIMALAPFFLVIFDDRQASVRHAAWTYLAATHLGTAFLLVLFVMVGGLAGTSDFSGYTAALRDHPTLSSGVFLLALVGFGSKAGIVPAHVWLPEAHPVAPSHASALMSGAMIKVGIILLGIGLGVLGLAQGMTTLAVIGFAAGLLHVLNHSIFKGLLFLGAGAVQHAAGSLELEELGGLFKRMPWTGTTFLIGSAAIVGLPPLNGFISEFLLFYAGFLGLVQSTVNIAVAGLITLVAMGLISGLAAACFAKAFGIVFLGS